ncbi:MAG TPA: FG-GAP-like repeat-containing protein, partial [Vicinamibacterales bacterium]|nr:FG-GAP-like repeat-containing protein [Vicinamibacterales bacterium]
MTRPSTLTLLLACLPLLVLTACRSDSPAAPQAAPSELVSALNHGVAQMGRYDFAAAATAFAAATKTQPESPEAALDLALAFVNRQREGDGDEAERLLRPLLTSPAVGQRASYALGLLLLYAGRDAEAFPLLSQVAGQAPGDAFPAYFAGQAALATAPEDAVRWFTKAQAANPLLRSAYYGAFQALQRLGRADEARRMLARFQALESDPRALVAEFKYTRMGPLAMAVTVDAPARAPATPPTGPRFLPAAPITAPVAVPWRSSGAEARSITVADIDGDGRLDIFAANVLEAGAPNALLLSRDDGWQLDLAHPLAAVTDVRAALWGDLDNDGRIDVVLVRGAGRTTVWRQTATNVWRDVTDSSRATSRLIDGVDGALVDADHDGDLDIWLTNAAGPNELLSNNGNGTFRPISRTADLDGGRGSVGLAVVDLDHDRDQDLVVLNVTPPHDVFINDLAWHYRRAPGFEVFAATPFDAVLGADLDANGQVELYTTGPRGLERWTPDAAGVWRPVQLAAPVGGRASRLALADTNGDGTLELVTTQGRSWAALDVTAEGGLATTNFDAGIAVNGWTVAYLDAARGPSIIGASMEGLTEWAPGPGRHPYLTLGLTGRDSSSDQLRSNVSGIGTRVAVRAESRWTAFDTARPQSGPGQSLQAFAIGLAGAPRADFVALTWPDGVLQTELDLEGGRLHTIEETQRQLSSCPVLFAFNGSAMAFVTDILGVGGIGFFERPGVYSEPFPREHILFPNDSLAPRNGRYELVIGEPMEEVTYLDRASLVAYDLPAGWQMALDERKAIAGPMPTSAPVFFRDERRPVLAMNDRGQDVTAAVSAADLTAAPPGKPDARFIGLTEPHTLELTFDRALDRGPGRPVLMIDGWLEYPYAQTMFAAWQAGAVYAAPSLDARGADGRWHTVAPEFGYPAGM